MFYSYHLLSGCSELISEQHLQLLAEAVTSKTTFLKIKELMKGDWTVCAQRRKCGEPAVLHGCADQECSSAGQHSDPLLSVGNGGLFLTQNTQIADIHPTVPPSFTGNLLVMILIERDQCCSGRTQSIHSL